MHLLITNPKILKTIGLNWLRPFYQCPVWPIVYLNLLYASKRIFTHRYDLMDALFVSFSTRGGSIPAFIFNGQQLA